MQRLPGSARSFFETRFFDRTFNETKKQILTRLWGVLSNTTLERMFSHPRNKLDLYQAINSGKIILINTAKDLLKQEGCAIFGRFFISLLAQAAMERASIAPHARRATFLYIDEAQDYFDENIGHLLNQARKFRVGIVFAHQNLDQLSPALRSSVMASTSIKFVGGVSAKDARVFADETRCDDGVLLKAQKRQRHTEFACYVRNFTPRAVTVSVPLGVAESQPVLAEAEYQALIDSSRRLCSVRLEDMEQFSEAPVAPAAPKEILTSTARTPSSQARTKDGDSNVSTAASVKLPEHTELSAHTIQSKKRTREPAPLGRGGQQHTYLQQLIKLAAQERGYLAVIEESVLDGTGKVDVSLSKAGRKIACEISISTGKDWELGNVEKCLAAGYDDVLVIAKDDRQLDTLSKFIGAHLDENVRERVHFVTPDGARAYIDGLVDDAPPTEEAVRGYRVKVSRTKIDPSEAQQRRRAIAAILARSLNEHQAK